MDEGKDEDDSADPNKPTCSDDRPGRRTTVRAGLEHEYVVQCKLSKGIHQFDGRQAFVTELQAMVDHVSKLAHRGSVLFGHMLLYALQNDRLSELNFDKDSLYYQAFCYNQERNCKAAQGVLSDAMAACGTFAKTVALCRRPNDSQAITFKAREYRTAFHNSIWMNFEKRQYRWVKAMCDNEAPELAEKSKKRLARICCCGVVPGWV